MPSRYRTRKHLPFVELPRHKRRDAVIKLGWKIARQAEGYPFWTDHLLVDPEDPQRIHHWIDVYFLGADRFTLWNATIVMLQLAKQDELSDRSFKLACAQLSADEINREFAIETINVPRTRPGQMRSRQWIQQPKQGYPQFDGRTFHAECERLEAHLLATDPPDIKESFAADRGYAYGVGLDAVVDEPTLDKAAIERKVAFNAFVTLANGTGQRLESLQEVVKNGLPEFPALSSARCSHSELDARKIQALVCYAFNSF